MRSVIGTGPNFRDILKRPDFRKARVFERIALEHDCQIASSPVMRGLMWVLGEISQYKMSGRSKLSWDDEDQVSNLSRCEEMRRTKTKFHISVVNTKRSIKLF